MYSWLPWFDIFYKLLEKLGELCYHEDVSILQPALSALHSLPVPLAGHTAILPLAKFSQVTRLDLHTRSRKNLF